MPYRQYLIAVATITAALTTFLSTPSAASAATPLSVEVGAQFPLADSGRNAGGTSRTALGLDYDLGPQTLIPIRASVHLDDANGSRGNGRLNTFGAGLAARLTTPIYAGAGLSLVTVNARPDVPNAVTTNATGIATSYFFGERLFSVPGGTSVSLQATFKKFPRVGGVDPSAFALGVRVQL